MTIARASGQTAQATGTISASSLQITFPQSVVVGNFISACGAHRTAFSSMADNLGNAYGLDVEDNVQDGSQELALTSAKKLTTGGSCTVTWTATGASRIGLCAMEYEGFGSGGAVLADTAVKDESATTTLETNAADLSGSDGLGIAFGMNSANGFPASSWGNSFASVVASDINGGRCELADRVLSGAGSYEATATLAATVDYAAALAIYRPDVFVPGANAPTLRSRFPTQAAMRRSRGRGLKSWVNAKSWW